MNANDLNPFPGLRPFRPEEDYLFFGREDQTMQLLQRLGDNRFVSVVGTSGSGKSSLVRCGLLSELQGGKLLRAGTAWEIAVTHPGGNPLALLAEAFFEAELYDPDEEHARERLLATLNRSHFGLVEAVKQARLGSDTNFLLVVDQFEEIFRFHEAGQTQQEVANEFVSQLLQAVQQQEVPIYIVITMRSDFIGECSQFEGLSEMVNRGEFLIPRLTREEYKRVIESPIKVAGGTITPRLLQRLLNDLGQQADQLPCLQHALMRTWVVAHEQDPAKPLDLEDYQCVGRMSHALSLHADEVYASLGSDRQRELCAGIFQALTVQESEKRGVRRPQRLGNLSQILDVPADELLPVIDAYRQPGVTFLMPPAEVEIGENTIIDISHESLMRVWTRLRRWAGDESQAAAIYRRLSESAVMYQQGKAGLYRDPELAIALGWRETRRPNAAWAARYHRDFATAIEFLGESQREAQQAEQLQEAARQRELQQAKQLAETQRMRADDQRRAASRLRWLVAALGAIAVLAIVAFVSAALAHRRATENEGRAVAAHADALRAADTTRQALAAAQLAREEAERAGQEEKKQRQLAETQTELAETQTAAAVQAQRQLQAALGEAEAARQLAEEAQMRAESSRQRADDDRRRAEEAEQKAVDERQVAEREKLLAETNAELARRREQLFEKLLPLLQEHAAEGVEKYAQRLEDEGKPREALETFADFGNLVLGDQQAGLLARELLDLDLLEIQGLDSDVVAAEISVPPPALFRHVLTPAIELGERLLADGSDSELQQLVTRLHSHRARLLKQHPQEQWPATESAAEMIFHSANRAATLDPDSYERFLERAGARIRLPNPEIPLVLADLDQAIQLYPDPPQAAENRSVTDQQRQFAEIQHARANILEFLALRDESAVAARRLRESEQAHRRARSLDPHNPSYSIGVARTLRKRYLQAGPGDSPIDLLARAEKQLVEVQQEAADLPEYDNELGELFILQDRTGEARQAFERAVADAKRVGRERGLYVYYCNLANAYSREPADQADYAKAQQAAENAIALQTESAVEGLYYRGFVLWKRRQIPPALQALSEVIEREPAHVAAQLAKYQIIFELREPNPATAAQLTEAYDGAARVLAYADLTNDEQAKAFYVNSLGWLRRHVQERSEQALVNCQQFALQAVQGSQAYAEFARGVFLHASRFAWQNAELQQESAQLQEMLAALLDDDSRR